MHQQKKVTRNHAIFKMEISSTIGNYPFLFLRFFITIDLLLFFYKEGNLIVRCSLCAIPFLGAIFSIS
jgi:hypothetical protein